MSRQRQRAIMRRLARLEERPQEQLTADEMVDQIIEIDALSREFRQLIVDRFQRRGYISPAEARLLQHFKERL